MSNADYLALGSFQTTHWSLVERAGISPATAQRQALVELLRRYVPALRSHLVLSRRIDPDRAEDLLQGFLLSRVIEQDLLGVARRERGRFRGFLCTSLDRFVSNEFRHDRAKKRSAEGGVSLDQELAVADPAPPVDGVFEVTWARQLLEQAVTVMRQQCEATGRRDVWGVFEGRLLSPLLHDAPAANYAELCRRYNLASPAQASNVLITARRMFVRVLRLIGEYEKDETEIDAEINDLLNALSRVSS